ncbi:MAG: AAA family ATPase [Bacteroidales bacterium]|nr:AAA family ATPase [Bacteroidales bacterium]
MIKNIAIKDCASFDSVNGINFAPTLVNYIYGSNGSGKTAISNVIRDCTSYPLCSLDWGLAAPLQTLVYNRTFIEENFEQSKELKGIFTLGKGSKEELEKIKVNQAEVEKREKSIIDLKGTLENEKLKLLTIEDNFVDKCWGVQKKYEGIFIKAFEGNRNSKQRFKDKVVSEYAGNKRPLLLFAELESKASQILNAPAVKVAPVIDFSLPDFNTLEENPIFQTRIIGKDDVDIARMILKLNNSDWVRQGIVFFKANDEYCPFCQQTTTESFRKQLDEYFDESYNQQLQALKNAYDKYNFECETLLIAIGNYLALNNQFIDLPALTGLRDMIVTKQQKNLLTIEKKLNEPTIKITLDSISEHIVKLKEIIDQAITKSKEHNRLIDNIESEKKALISNIWSFILNELRLDFGTYTSEKDSSEKAIKSVSTKITTIEGEVGALKTEIQNSESKITSTKPTIGTINKTLTGFGFTNFSLAETTTVGGYKIVRENGVDAKNTLSEGEKTFITFLYFYHLTNGSFETNQITTNKILVIDDPISSLDSAVLFIVSNLVRKLISECREGKSHVKQVFVLTHNVYFHKEVTFKKRSESSRGESYWIIRKIGKNSTIEKYKENPVQTSYDLLWQEIRDRASINKLTVFNTLRRILEYYFKILGKIKDDELLDKFDGEDKIISNSLLSWINDGSHTINDDIFISTDEETVEKYLRVFKRIFEVESQIEHYNMMMKVPVI